MPEQWRPIPGYAGLYEVSDEGRVRSLPRSHPYKGTTRTVAGRVLKLGTDSRGYRTVQLYSGGRSTRKPFWVAVLVALLGWRFVTTTVSKRITGSAASDTTPMPATKRIRNGTGHIEKESASTSQNLRSWM